MLTIQLIVPVMFACVRVSSTCCVHLNAVRLHTGVTDSHCVEGTNSEAILSLRVETRADPIRGVLTLVSQNSPVPRLGLVQPLMLHHVARDGRSSVEARPGPGQNQRRAGQLGHERTRGWRVRTIWGETKWI